MKYTIYYIKNKINNKLYVGYTSRSINIRFEEHIKNAKNKVNRRLYDSMNFHGYNNFSIKKLDECDDKLQAQTMESWYIFLLNSKNPDKGYNMTWGGDGGYTLSNWSDEDKKKLYAQQAKHRESSILAKYGVKTMSQLDKIKAKISNAKKGKKITEEHKKNISNTIKRKIKTGEIILNTSGLKSHKKGEFKHTDKSKKKMSKARIGKVYNEIFDKKTANRLIEMHRQMWTGKNNPNYVENITDTELCYIIKQSIIGMSINKISKDISKSPYKIRQRLKNEGINNIQNLKRKDKKNNILITLLKKYEK